jgi:hypothetical protein
MQQTVFHLSLRGVQTYAEPFGGKADEPFLICHREERSDVAIHLEFLRGLPQSASLLRNDNGKCAISIRIVQVCGDFFQGSLGAKKRKEHKDGIGSMRSLRSFAANSVGLRPRASVCYYRSGSFKFATIFSKAV